MSGAATGRRRLDASVPQEYDQPVRPPRLPSNQLSVRLGVTVGVGAILGLLGSLTGVVAVDAPSWLYRPSAALLTVTLTIGLVHRAGGRMRIWVTMVALVCAGAVLTDWAGLVAVAAALTGVVGAVSAVVFTRPAYRLRAALREYAVCVGVAVSGAVGVAAWNAQVNVVVFVVMVVGVSMVVVIGLTWKLGQGIHGLGRNHLAMLAGVAAVLLLLVVYSYVLRSYGSVSLVNMIDSSIYWARSTIGGVPRPVQALVGFPALVVGVRVRSQRREGWWVLVFAALATSSVTTGLVSPLAYPTYMGLSMVYSAIVGFGVGWLLSRFVMAPTSARSARAIQPVRRVEPPRWAGLR
ncbi:MAG: hypothetical protein QM621_14080 [Aeromicrobium sp.]|uniref:hypothetical protein n=1 Tax=Aeromicrobium sp. TaxID=1871063 RepID=UPI0039E60E7E